MGNGIETILAWPVYMILTCGIIVGLFAVPALVIYAVGTAVKKAIDVIFGENGEETD